jgi:hypothetical protein
MEAKSIPVRHVGSKEMTMKMLRCTKCDGKGYTQARGMVRIGASHCGNVKQWCLTCRRTGKVTEAQAKRQADGA